MGDAGIEALTRALPQMASLMTLKFSSIASLLAGALPLMTALTTLDLSGAAGVRLELPSVSGCYHAPGLRLWCGALCLFVRLTGSRLGDSAAEALAGALPKMASLMTLHLRGTSSLSLELSCAGVSMLRPIRG
jgi:hypothetical protein